jgi:hypothetical protein
MAPRERNRVANGVDFLRHTARGHGDVAGDPNHRKEGVRLMKLVADRAATCSVADCRDETTAPGSTPQRRRGPRR